MNQMDIMLAEHACAKLAIKYANCLDLFEDAAVLDLFAPDGVWNHMTKGPLRGRVEIGAFLAGRDRNLLLRHVASNFETEVLSETRATGRSYWTAYRAKDAEPGKLPVMGVPLSIGAYADEFVCIEGRWHFAARSMQPLYSGT